MCRNSTIRFIDRPDISFCAIVKLLQHDINCRACKGLSHNLRFDSHLNKSRCILPCNTDILRHLSLCGIHHRLLYNLDFRIIKDYKKCCRLLTTAHIKANISGNCRAYDDTLIVNDVKFIDHQSIADLIQSFFISNDFRILSKQISKSSRLGKIIFSDILSQSFNLLIITVKFLSHGFKLLYG